MIRIFSTGLALLVAGSGAVMAQNAQNPAGSPAYMSAKVEARLPPTRVSLREAPAPQPNAILDAHGRVVPLAAVNVDAVHPGRECTTARRMRPAEIRKIAEAEAERIGLALDLVVAVIRAEGLVGPDPSGSGTAMLHGGSAESSCTDQEGLTRKAVVHLARMRQLYPAPVHHLTAYREGEEAFLASGGVPERSETLRFVITALNELATPPGELAAANRPRGARKAGAPPAVAATQAAALRTPQTGSHDPRWVSGFVFNLE
ncbi:MAG: hypothetical protein ACK5TM_09360 [Methylobacterium sp.]